MGSKISITRDLTKQELIQRANLRKAAEERNKQGTKTKMKGNKLKINEDWYIWDSRGNKLKQVNAVHKEIPGRTQTSVTPEN